MVLVSVDNELIFDDMKPRYYDAHAFIRSNFFERMNADAQQNFRVLTQVFHFKVNNYVVDQLIDWENIPDDPIYKLVFPRVEMLETADFERLRDVLENSADSANSEALISGLRLKYKPFVRFSELSIPRVREEVVPGAYQSTKRTLFLFPKPMVRTCHAYCSYCFRWASFDDYEAQKFSYSDPASPIAFLELHPEISEVLFTGADPLTLRSETLRAYIEPLLKVNSIKTININTKSLTYWPYRFVTDSDANELLSLFSRIVSSGKSINLCTHFSHPAELNSPILEQATALILSTGVTIRTQGPIIRDLNDSGEIWAQLWKRQISLRMVPKHMFIEAGHNRAHPFQVSLNQALSIYEAAMHECANTDIAVPGPMFMNDILNVAIIGRVMSAETAFLKLLCLESPPGLEVDNRIRLVCDDGNANEIHDLLGLFSNEVVLA